MSTEDAVVSSVERQHMLRCLCSNVRSDGRFFHEGRRVSFQFSRSEGKSTAELVLGHTRVLAVVTAAITAPFPDRPLEGVLTFQSGRPSAEALHLGRMLERQIRGARALDTEALCVEPGERVWSLHVDVHVLCDAGNLIDACALSAMAALLHFRRADVSVSGQRVTVHSYTERAPVPLSVHHIPLCISFACFNSPADRLASFSVAGIGTASVSKTERGKQEEVLLMDPTSREEIIADGSLTFIMNAHAELCGIQKLGGCPVQPSSLTAAARVAGERAKVLVADMKAALVAAEAAHQQKMRQEHSASGGLGIATALSSGRFVDVTAEPLAATTAAVTSLIASSLNIALPSPVAVVPGSTLMAVNDGSGAAVPSTLEMDFVRAGDE